MNKKILAFSGKIASGKNTIAETHSKQNNQEKTIEYAFGIPLKKEVQEIIDFVRKNEKNKINYYYDVEKTDKTYNEMAQKINCTKQELTTIIQILRKTIIENPEISVKTKTKEIREALQYWGNIRRTKNQNYWIDKTIKEGKELLNQSNNTILYIIDCRYKNEAEALKKENAIIIRLEVSPEEQEKRILKRDKTRLTKENKQHLSETDLDNYQDFDIIINTDHKTTKEIVDEINNFLKE